MPADYEPEIEFVNASTPTGTSMPVDGLEEVESLVPEESSFPPPILKIKEETIDAFKIWLDEWLMTLISEQSDRQKDWAEYEKAFRARPEAPKSKPFVGASNEVVPTIAMAVDPVFARLDTGIFKQDPVFTVKPLRASTAKYVHAISNWVEYYQRNKLKLRAVAAPRLLECAKLGTAVFKTTYDKVEHKIKSYDQADNWKVIDKVITKFKGPRVFGISINDFLFPPMYQTVQDCPIVAERQRPTYMQLMVAQASGKITNCDQIKAYGKIERTDLESAREKASGHATSRHIDEEIVVYEVWCDYDIDGDGLPESIVCTYHLDSHTILQLRYNWYFHQRKPYTVMPYALTNDSLYGIGIAEMVMPMQRALTKFQQMSLDNAYIANIRMFIVKKESGIDEVPRLYTGRCFFVDDPKSDFIPFASGDIYPSTLAERQNLFGLAEKRTGVSDYLSGRESPIIGSRATATSTLALIQEGTKRVEQVLENLRAGFSEIIENCLYLWIQYGLDDIDDLVFGDDETKKLLNEFFSTLTEENVNGAFSISLSATDAAGNRQVTQQMQLQIIQIMMQYLEKLLAAGQGALQAQQVQPQLAAMIADVMTAARNMFKDLLFKYDIRNPEDYLPDLTTYLGGMDAGQNGAGEPVVGSGGIGGIGGMANGRATLPVPTGNMPSQPGSGSGFSNPLPFAR